MAPVVRTGEKVFQGIPVSPGVCRGRVVVLRRAGEDVVCYPLEEKNISGEMKRLEHAMVKTREQIMGLQEKVAEAMGEKDAMIFDAQLVVLDDPTLIDGITRYIQEHRCNVEYACLQVTEKYIDAITKLDDDFFRERAADLKDVAERLQSNLHGRSERNELPVLSEPSIIISDDLAPSATAQLDRKLTLGFATDTGGRTSHTAILARSLQIPAVVGLKEASLNLVTGDQVLLDGFNGLVILNPTDQTLFEYGQVVRRQLAIHESLQRLHDEPAVTLDGVRITLSANVQQCEEASEVLASGAEGVGLFRTEYLFLGMDRLPTEDEQYETYRKVAEALRPQAVVIRTLDLGGDKFIAHLPMPQELNPFLGRRAIRFCLQELDLFRAQLRAILRASAHGNIKLMYPMISGLEELNRANEVLEECKRGLRSAGVRFDETIEVGAMIEIPSAVMVADSLAKRVKFFSIGTNDLIQYTLAVDRLNEQIAHLYDPTHPAILRMIKVTVDAAHRNGIWVGVCGEMAGDPAVVPLLIGLGVDELSVVPGSVPQIKSLIRRMNRSEAVVLAEQALRVEWSAEVLASSKAFAQRAAPSLFEAVL